MGVLLALGTALAFSVMNLSILKGGRVHPSPFAVLNTLVVNVVTFSVLFALAAATGNLREIRPEAVAAFSSIGLTGAFLGRTFLFAGIDRIGVVRASAIKNGSPIVTLVMAMLWIGERLTPLGGLGIVLILGSVFVVVRESLLSARRIGAAAGPAAAGSASAGPASAESASAESASAGPAWAESASAQSASAGPAWASRVSGADLRRQRQVAGVSLAVLSALTFGASNALSKVGMDIVPDVIQAGTFAAWAGLGAYLVAVTMRGELGGVLPGLLARRPWFWLAGVAGSAGQIAFFAALDFIEVGPATVVAASEVVLTTALGGLLLQHLEHVTRRIAVPAILVFLGAALIALSR